MHTSLGARYGDRAVKMAALPLAILATALLQTAHADSRYPFCFDTLVSEVGLLCADGSNPSDGGCCGDTCSGMDCCPGVGCTGISYGGGVCSCTGCSQNTEMKLAITTDQRWLTSHVWQGQARLIYFS